MSKIHEVLPKIMGEVGAIGKDRKNVQQGYAFRGIDDVYNAAQPAFVKHGVFIVPRVKTFSFSERESKQGGILRFCVCELEANFTADDGSSIQTVTIGEALDSGDKAAGKAQSYALKVAVLQTLCIPTEGDNDTENHSHEPKHGGSAANTTPPARTAPTSTPRPAAPAAPSPAQTDAAPTGFREFWNESEWTEKTLISIAKIVAVNEPKKSEKTGKFGPYKIDCDAEGTIFVVDTFDKNLADICKASGDALREVAYDEVANGRFTNRNLMGIR